MIVKRKGQNVVLCDVCGGIISWEINSNLKYGYVCTKCIDKEFGKYRVLDLHKYDLNAIKINTDKLSDDIMSELADRVSSKYLLGQYWTDLQEEADDMGLMAR